MKQPSKNKRKNGNVTLAAILKSRKNAFLVSFFIIIAFVALVYVFSAQDKISKLNREKKNIENALSNVKDSLAETSSDLDEANDNNTKITDKIEALNKENSDNKATIKEQEETLKTKENIISALNQIIDSQKATIDSQNEQIKNQQETIDKTEEAINEIADLIGKDITPISGDSLYNGLATIEDTEEVIAKAFKDSPKVLEYMAILDDKKAEINEQLKYYPDYNPAKGKISYTFGNHFEKVDGKTVTKFHRGLDICNGNGGPIYACAEGTVTEVHLTDDGTGLGYYVRINHGNGYETLYGHLKSACVKVGQTVTKGQQIGMMGRTGCATGTHVHLEIRLNGELQDPLNYVDY